MASWIRELGHRLNAIPYLDGAIEARKLIEGLSIEKTPLRLLTRGYGGGIFNGPRFARNWVEETEHGIPLLSGTDILRADITDAPLISNRSVATMPYMRATSGTTLITSYGTIGRTAYVRSDIAGRVVSDNVMKVVPNENNILPGYLFAYLSCRFGVILITHGTGGAGVPYLDPRRLHNIPVPRFGRKIEQRVHDLVQEAAKNRTEAGKLLATAVASFYSELRIPRPITRRAWNAPLCTAASSRRLQERLDAYYFCEPNEESRRAFDSADCLAEIGEVAEVFIPGIFKRRYADDPAWGVPYLTGADIFTLCPQSEDYLMASVAAHFGLVLREGMIVIQEAGQLSGLIGRSVLVGRYLEGFACTNNMIRVVPGRKEDTGYIYAVLSSEHGVRLIKREAAGSSIPHLERNRVARTAIPWPKDSTRERLGRPVIRAVELRDAANELESKARQIVEVSIQEGA